MGFTLVKDAPAGPEVRDADGFEAPAISMWPSAGKTFGDPLLFVSGGEPWWVDSRPVWRDSAPPWIALTVPVSSLTAETKSRQHRYAAVLIAVFVTGSLIAIVAGCYVDGERPPGRSQNSHSPEIIRGRSGRRIR